MCARLPGVEQLLAGDDPREGEARGDPLRHHQDVGLNVLVLHGEHLSGAPVAGLHLVGDQQNAELTGEFAKSWQEASRRHNVATLAQDRLNDDRGNIFGAREGVQCEIPLLLPAAAAPSAGAWGARNGRITCLNWCTEAGGECGAVDRTWEWFEVAAVDVLRRGQRHRLRGATVIAAAEGEDHAALGGASRQLHRRLDCLRSRVRQEDAPRPTVEHRAESLVQPQPWLMEDDVLLAVDQLGGLLGNGGGNLRMRMPRVHHADPRGVVEPALAATIN